MLFSELIHLVAAGKEDWVSFSDGENIFEINLRLENCYQFLELIIIIKMNKNSLNLLLFLSFLFLLSLFLLSLFNYYGIA